MLGKAEDVVDSLVIAKSFRRLCAREIYHAP